LTPSEDWPDPGADVAPEERPAVPAIQAATPPRDDKARVALLETRIQNLQYRVAFLELAWEAARATQQAGVRPATLPTTVTVTLNGQPVGAARVIFVPLVAGRHAAFGLSDADGKARLTTFELGDGALPGPYRVTISKTLLDVTGPKPELRCLLPPQYASPETTGLSVEVAVGANDFAFDLRD
jgi:hypothetical protein